MAETATLLTAEDFARLPESDQPTELIRGQVVTMNPPSPRHGQVCTRIVRILGDFVEEHDLGHVLCNDAGIVTERDPDTVRGADIAFYSYQRVPKGPLPAKYLSVAPDIVFEVRSANDRWSKILAKAAEYLDAGVRTVCVLDPDTETAQVFYPDHPSSVLSQEQELTLPEPLDGFRVEINRFFR